MITDEDILAEMQRIAERELGHKAPLARGQSLLADLHLDSLGLMTMAVGLEDRFQVFLSEEDAPQLETVADVIALVRKRIDAG